MPSFSLASLNFSLYLFPSSFDASIEGVPSVEVYCEEKAFLVVPKKPELAIVISWLSLNSSVQIFVESSFFSGLLLNKCLLHVSPSYSALFYLKPHISCLLPDIIKPSALWLSKGKSHLTKRCNYCTLAYRKHSIAFFTMSYGRHYIKQIFEAVLYTGITKSI